MAQQMQTYDQNLAVRNSILARAIPIIQNVKSGTLSYNAGSPTTTTILASNVGLIRRFYLVISGTLNCAASHTITPTVFGLANLLSNISFQDQNNRLRINTTGAHLHFNATQKRKRAFGAAILAGTGMSDPTGLGSNFPVQVTPGVVAGGTPKNFTFIWELPVIASNSDLTGAIYANQTTSNNQITFTINPNAFVFNADPYNAVGTTDVAVGTALPTMTNLTFTLYQDFLDQLPNGADGYAVLPQVDLSYALNVIMINAGTQVAGADNLYPLPPFNVYNNLQLFWDNYGTAGAPGADVQYIKTQVANTYVLSQLDPLMLAVKTRNTIGTDFPGAAGATGFSGAVYDLDYRAKPLSVNQLSSTNVVFRPTTVSAGSALNIGQEYLWLANQQAA